MLQQSKIDCNIFYFVSVSAVGYITNKVMVVNFKQNIIASAFS